MHVIMHVTHACASYSRANGLAKVYKLSDIGMIRPSGGRGSWLLFSSLIDPNTRSVNLIVGALRNSWLAPFVLHFSIIRHEGCKQQDEPNAAGVKAKAASREKILEKKKSKPRTYITNLDS